MEQISTNLGKVVITPKGVYNPEVEYKRLDLIQYEGSSYIVLQTAIGITPIDGEFYMLIARKGEKGDKGDAFTYNDLTSEQKAELKPNVSISDDGNGNFVVSIDDNESAIEISDKKAREQLDRLDELIQNVSKNLIDESKVKDGFAVGVDGVEKESVSFKSTDYIYLEAGSYVYSNNKNSFSSVLICLYDTNKVFKEYKLEESTFIVVEPCYVRIREIIGRTNMQLEVGTEPTPYEPYKEAIKPEYIPIDNEVTENSMKPISSGAVKVYVDDVKKQASYVNDLLDIGSGKNLFDVDKITDGKYLHNECVTGGESEIRDGSTNSVSDWMNVEPNETYIIHASADNVDTTIHFCDNDNILVADTFMFKRDVIFIIPDNCTKLRLSARSTVLKSGEFLFSKCENLFDNVVITTDMALTSGLLKDNTSTIVSNSGYSVSDWIEVDNNSYYVAYCSDANETITIHCCDNNGVLGANAITFTKNLRFGTSTKGTKIRISAKTEVLNSNNFKLAKAKTIDDYEEYLYVAKNEKFRIERYENMLGDIETVLENVVGGV